VYAIYTSWAVAVIPALTEDSEEFALAIFSSRKKAEKYLRDSELKRPESLLRPFKEAYVSKYIYRSLPPRNPELKRNTNN